MIIFFTNPRTYLASSVHISKGIWHSCIEDEVALLAFFMGVNIMSNHGISQASPECPYEEWKEKIRQECKNPNINFEDRFMNLIGFLKDSCNLLYCGLGNEEMYDVEKPPLWLLSMMEYSLDEVDIILYEMLSRLPNETKQAS